MDERAVDERPIVDRSPVRRRLIVLGLAVLLLVGACAAVTRPLPAYAREDAYCSGALWSGLVLAGAPWELPAAWVVDDEGRRSEITWPEGYWARFLPDLEVVDAAGATILRAGDQVRRACVPKDLTNPTGEFIYVP